MSGFGLIPFCFGCAASEVLSPIAIDFYKWIVKSTRRQELQLVQLDSYSTLAISVDELLEDSSAPYQKTLSFTKDWVKSASVIVVDIIEPSQIILPGKMEVHLAAALLHLWSSQKSLGNDVFFIILRSQLPPQGEAFRLIIDRLLSEGNALLISDAGEVLSNDEYIPAFKPEQYRLRRANAQGDPLKLLEAKMIRRLGHFRREGGIGDNQCERFFFDGTQCDKEIANLIKRYISENYKDKSHLLLLYHCTISMWLKEPVTAVATKVGSFTCNIEDVLNDEYTLEYDQIEKFPILVVVPRVVTGKTIERIVRKLKTINSNANIKFLAILSTDPKCPTGMFRSIAIDNIDYRIDFFLLDSQSDSRPYQTCELCKLGLPYSNYLHDDYAMLTTYDFWGMANDVGWKPEDNVPYGRDALSLVPDFPKMFYQNGAWLAWKTLNRLKFSLDEFPVKPFLIVCPDEVGANTVSEYLRVLHDSVTIVSIPANVLNAYRKIELESNIIDETEFWFKQLHSAAPSQPIVLMEEFSVSGGTKSALYRLVRDLKKEVRCHFALVNFNFRESSQPQEYPSLSLYELDLGLI